MLAPKLQRNLIRILPFGVIWLVMGWVFLFSEYAATRGAVFPEEQTAIEFDAGVLIFASIAVTLVGVLIGVIELLFMRRFFARKSLMNKVVGKFFLYASFLFLVVTITYPIAASIELGQPMLHPEIWTRFLNYLSSITFISTALQMVVSLVMTIFYAEISDSLGYGVFLDFVLGKYHKPKQEERIFMFLDMKSSTSIAESLGHEAYFHFLKAYFRILSEELLNYSGEIYQYVGDELVVSWKMKKGLENNACIQCFFAMESALKARKNWFEEGYGVAPEFKAGFHYGEVTTGEIGQLKTDIIFTGDVLNTAARIQSMCNSFNVCLLISSDLLNRLSVQDSFLAKSLGSVELRGRSETVELFTLLQR
ncbi:MAG: adenylate/guanylate cyclase domain-containing protein [Saprospiraceae bacterium]|nr:adenylate/guanylate cyclase domain-containing protein [Saprospiraceae bacterium]